jgi:hypothetical protein
MVVQEKLTKAPDGMDVIPRADAGGAQPPTHQHKDKKGTVLKDAGASTEVDAVVDELADDVARKIAREHHE